MSDDEPFLTAKEISAELEGRGMKVSARYIRDLWKAGAPHVGRYGQVKALLHWWEKNPGVEPRAQRNTTGSMRIL